MIRSPSFTYRRLTPNLHEYVGTDCDAFTSMDPHTAILYFRGRGWNVLSHPTSIARMLVRHGAVVVQKPSAKHKRRLRGPPERGGGETPPGQPAGRRRSTR